MRFCFLDIETVLLKIDNNIVIEYLMDHKITKEMRTFNPHYARIICICLKFSDEQETKVFFNEDEIYLLNEFWNTIQLNTRDVVFVTHNGYGFDVPFINMRSFLNEIHVPFYLNLNKWKMDVSNHFDTMIFLSQGGIFTNMPLNLLAEMHDMSVKDTILGNEIDKCFNNREHDKIIEKCKNDVELLEKIFHKLCINYRKNKF